MGLAYFFALVVALGILAVQILMGARGGHHLGHGHGHGGHAHPDDGQPALWTLFFSLRFWTFALLGFGLSGSLLHLFSLASPLATFLVAASAGIASGAFAVIAFRLVARGSIGTEARTSLAVGRVARVVVPFGLGATGQVRVEIGGSSVDLMAITEGDDLAKGDEVLVEDVRDGIAMVSRRPSDLS